METNEEILLALGRIEGELIEIRKLHARVWRLKIWQGGWAALVGAFLYLWRK